MAESSCLFFFFQAEDGIRDVAVTGVQTCALPISDGATEFFGVTESPEHRSNECRIAFWAESVSEVDKLAEIAARAGARNIEGPAREIPQPGETGYYAVFFEDPCGNRFEVCHRTKN